MLIETQTSKRFGEIPVVAVESSASRQRFVWQNIRASLSFFTVLLQFGLIVLLINHWQLESLSLGRVMELAFAGFVIHHLLPQRKRIRYPDRAAQAVVKNLHHAEIARLVTSKASPTRRKGAELLLFVV